MSKKLKEELIECIKSVIGIIVLWLTSPWDKLPPSISDGKDFISQLAVFSLGLLQFVWVIVFVVVVVTTVVNLLLLRDEIRANRRTNLTNSVRKIQ